VNLLRWIVVGLVASFLSLPWGSCAAAETPPGLERFGAAVKRFEELINTAQRQNTMPRLGDPEVSDLLQTLSDVDGLLGTAKDNKEDVTDVLTICLVVERIQLAYEKYGSAELEDRNDANARAIRNFTVFQDELTPLMGFRLRCLARLVPAMEDVPSTVRPKEWNEVRRKYLVEFRKGIGRTFLVWFALLGDGPVKAENKVLLLSALAETASPFSVLMPLDQRKSILEGAKNVVVDEELKLYLDRIIAAMSWAYCGELCRR